jgi:hypothetical protein
LYDHALFPIINVHLVVFLVAVEILAIRVSVVVKVALVRHERVVLVDEIALALTSDPA